MYTKRLLYLLNAYEEAKSEGKKKMQKFVWQR